MGISSAMNAGVMGLSVNSSKLATISDNIANSETKGYKRANVEFNALVLTERPTTYDAGGVRASTIREIDDQGALLSTRNATDLAISGRGFLPVTDIADVQRSPDDVPLKLVRTGSFRPDQNGILQTQSGLVLMGWEMNDDGTFPELQSDLKPVKIDSLSLAAERTTEVSLQANLNADAAATDAATIPVTYYDALGKSVQIDFEFTKTATANVWEMRIFSDAGTQLEPSVSANKYRITFETDPAVGDAGGIKSVEVVDAANATVVGASNWDTATGNLEFTNGIQTIQFYLGAAGRSDGIVQFSAPSQALSISRDGSPASVLTGIQIDEQGLLDAIFDSGFRQTKFKIPIANVQNPNGMRALDGQAFALTRESGSIYFYDAGEGPTGSLVSSALEESTTDVAEELTQLIKTQRAYSSNAKIIQTVDEMLQETTNLKR
jgi:flagellar hook protein FlgE